MTDLRVLGLNWGYPGPSKSLGNTCFVGEYWRKMEITLWLGSRGQVDHWIVTSGYLPDRLGI